MCEKNPARQRPESLKLSVSLTGYAEYALEGFELDVMDYIVKRVSFERFMKACDKAREYIELKQGKNNTQASDYFFIKANNKIEKIFLEDILYIEAKKNYSLVRTMNGNYFTLIGLGNMEETLNKEMFMRVHKSFIVALGKIRCIEGNEIQISESKIPLSRRIKKELKDRLLKQ